MKLSPICFLLSIFSSFSGLFAGTQPEDMSLVWSDEFEGDGLPDSSKWSYDVGGDGWGNNELQYYTNGVLNNARVEEGHLVIEARRESYQNRSYTSARLVSRNKGDWLYGRIEVRAKLPAGRGTWPAIWMLPTDWSYGNWPDSGEIDIMEHVGYDMNRVNATVHTKSFNHTLGTQVGNNIVAANVDQKFHIYRLEWRPDRIDVFLDDTHYFSFQNDGKGYASWPFDQRFHLLLNLAIGGSWGGLQGVDDSIFPQRMEVDYVRVYAYNQPEAGFIHKIPGSISAVQCTRSIGVEAETTADVGGGLNLGWIQGGDQSEYQIDVERPGVYELNLRYASPKGATSVRVYVNGTLALSTGNLKSTGSWQSWTTERVGEIALEAGRQSLKLEFSGNAGDDLNLNWMSFFPRVNAVHKFFNPQSGAYFFTAFTQEADSVLKNLPQWRYQGITFGVEYGPTNQNAPVYRFFNNRSGSHFYTANADERDNVIAKLSNQFSYEGIAFYVEVQPQGLDPLSLQAREFFPVWRFFLQGTSSHFFTGDPDEVEFIKAFVPPEIMKYEGVAWYSDEIY